MNKVIPYLLKASAKPHHKLYVEVEDGVKGHWKNEQNFRTFIITKDKKLQWNEDIEMDPDAFYLQLVGKRFDHYASNQQLLFDSY